MLDEALDEDVALDAVEAVEAVEALATSVAVLEVEPLADAEALVGPNRKKASKLLLNCCDGTGAAVEPLAEEADEVEVAEAASSCRNCPRLCNSCPRVARALDPEAPPDALVVPEVLALAELLPQKLLRRLPRLIEEMDMAVIRQDPQGARAGLSCKTRARFHLRGETRVLRSFRLLFSARPKEAAQQLCALLRHQPALHAGAPMAGWLIEHPGPVNDAAALGVLGAEHHPTDPGLADRAGAHGAGLKADIEGQARQTVVADSLRRGANRQDLGMGRGVIKADRSVFSLGDHRSSGRIDDHSANRGLFKVGCGLRKGERSAHVGGVMIDHRRQGAQNPRRGQEPLSKPVDKDRADPQPARFAPALDAPPAVEGGGDLAADGERVAKALARAGVASRREVERFIAEGRVALNGKPLTTPAVKIEPGDILTVDGAVVNEREPTRLWRYHKPVGLLTTHSDPNGRPTVFQNLPAGLPRVISVGRLDINSEGLLLLTNDGTLARALELPKSGWIRRYRVRAYGRTNQAKLDELKKGVTVEGVAYGAVDAKIDKVTRTESTGGSNLWITVAITEGKNREVRRVMESIGLKVNRLIRLAYGPFALAQLPAGAVEEVGPRVIRELLSDFIPPENMPKGDRAGGLLLPEGSSGKSRRAQTEAKIGERSGPKGEADKKPKKVYKTGWAKAKPKSAPAKALAVKNAAAKKATGKATGPKSGFLKAGPAKAANSRPLRGKAPVKR